MSTAGSKKTLNPSLSQRPGSSLSITNSEPQVRRFSISSITGGSDAGNQSENGFATSIANSVRRLSAVDITGPKLFQGGIFNTTVESDIKGGTVTPKTRITVTSVNGEVETATSTSSSDQSSVLSSDEETLMCPSCGKDVCTCGDPFHDIDKRGESRGCFEFFVMLFGMPAMYSVSKQKPENKEETEIEMISNVKGFTDSEDTESDVSEDELLKSPDAPVPVQSPAPRRESVIDKMMDQLRRVSLTPTTVEQARSPSPIPKLPATVEERKPSVAKTRGNHEVSESDNTPNGTPQVKKKGLKNKLTKKLSNKSLKRMGSLKKEKPKK